MVLTTVADEFAKRGEDRQIHTNSPPSPPASRAKAGRSNPHAAALLRFARESGYDLRLIQDYLGHRDPRHTVHYTRIAGSRFEGIWR